MEKRYKQETFFLKTYLSLRLQCLRKRDCSSCVKKRQGRPWAFQLCMLTFLRLSGSSLDPLGVPRSRDSLAGVDERAFCFSFQSSRLKRNLDVCSALQRRMEATSVSTAASHLHKCPSQILDVAHNRRRYVRGTLDVGISFDCSQAAGAALSSKKTITAWSVCKAETDDRFFLINNCCSRDRKKVRGRKGFILAQAILAQGWEASLAVAGFLALPHGTRPSHLGRCAARGCLGREPRPLCPLRRCRAPAGPGSPAVFLLRPLRALPAAPPVTGPPAPPVLTTRSGGLVCARPLLYLARRAAARRRLPRVRTCAFHHAPRRLGDPAQSAPSRRRARLLASAAPNHLPPPRAYNRPCASAPPPR